MQKLPFQRKIISPGLRGIEDLIDPPYNILDIASARIFYSDLENCTFDTASYILWNKRRTFKVTNCFPWREISPRYLGDSHLGGKSVIEILPESYFGTDEEEFALINPTDDPLKLYALSTRHTFLKQSFTKGELQKFNAGLLGEGLGRQQAYEHPVWLAAFNGNRDEQKFVVDWVWRNSRRNEKLMGIYLEDPGKLCALTWKFRGLSESCNLLAIDGFNSEKKFLISH